MNAAPYAFRYDVFDINHTTFAVLLVSCVSKVRVSAVEGITKAVEKKAPKSAVAA